MKNLLVLLTCLLVCGASFAQKEGFEKLIIKNKDFKETKQTQWEILLTSTKGSLYYIGAEHLDHPEHQQFKKIKEYWEAFKPTIAFYEGPDRGVANSDTLTIKKFGESGYVRYLAKQSGIKTMSLEPSPVMLYNYLCSKFSQQQVDVYMLSKEAMRLRTRKNLTKEQITVELENLIKMFTKLLTREIEINTIAKLDLAFTKNFGGELKWWEAPISWFDPQKNDQRFTNQLAIVSTEYRDIYMVDILTKSVNEGHNVLAVVGKNHVPLQINALKYNLGLLKK